MNFKELYYFFFWFWFFYFVDYWVLFICLSSILIFGFFLLKILLKELKFLLFLGLFFLILKFVKLEGLEVNFLVDCVWGFEELGCVGVVLLDEFEIVVWIDGVVGILLYVLLWVGVWGIVGFVDFISLGFDLMFCCGLRKGVLKVLRVEIWGGGIFDGLFCEFSLICGVVLGFIGDRGLWMDEIEEECDIFLLNDVWCVGV